MEYDEYHDPQSSSGAMALKHLMHKPKQFMITIGDPNEEGEINEQWFKYEDNDQIFCLAHPNDVSSSAQNPYCNCCKKRYKDYKDTRYCQFCALAFCAKCRFKSRVFPKSIEVARGEICKICDRKFFIKDMMRDKILQVEA